MGMDFAVWTILEQLTRGLMMRSLEEIYLAIVG
jgi:hypothetical protein